MIGISPFMILKHPLGSTSLLKLDYYVITQDYLKRFCEILYFYRIKFINF